MKLNPKRTEALAKERLDTYRRLFVSLRSTRKEILRFWTRPFESLPFRLGESLAEAKVPYAFDDMLDRRAATAISELVSLLQRRFAPVSMGEPTPATATLREESMSSRFTGDGTLEREVASRASRANPHLDCGLLDSWLSREGSGAKLLNGLEGLLIRAIEEELRSRGTACHGYLATIAASDLLERKKELVKSVSIRGMTYERLEKAVGTCLFTLLDVAADSARASFENKNLGVDLDRTWLLIRTSLNPIAFVSIKSRALQNDLNPWQISPSTASILDEVYEEVLLHDPEPAALEAQMTRAVRVNPAATEAAMKSGLRAEARRRFFELLARFDDGRTDWLRLLASVMRRDAEVDALFTSSKSLDSIRRHLKKLEKSQPVDEDYRQCLKEIDDLVSALQRGDPTKREMPGLPEPEELSAFGLQSFLAFALDRFCDGRLEEAKGHLHDAREPGGGTTDLVEQWRSGRLYRFSADGRPFLMPMRRRTQAQLFIDLKGFTRRTHRAKEVVMADFMREQFYKPILEAARRRCPDLSYGGADESSIELQNLLGDAAAFAGASEDLVELADDLRRIGREYARRLDSAAPSVREHAAVDELARQVEQQEAAANARTEKLRKEAALVRERMEQKSRMPDEEKVLLLERMLETRHEEMGAAREKARRRLAECNEEERLAIDAHLRRLDSWERELNQRQETTRKALASMPMHQRSATLSDLVCRPERRRLAELEEELARATTEASRTRRMLEERQSEMRGFGLETGIYISHGASAEVISFQDDLFGTLRVAISEKINEAARGTARNPEIKAKMDAHLERARVERGRPGLSWPFLVYVDSAYSLVLPPKISDQVEKAVRDNDMVAAEEVSVELSRWALRDISRAIGKGDGKSMEMLRLLNDVHNLGVALSEEALAAFVEETLAKRFHFQHTAPIAELHRDLQEPFVYLEDHLPLVVSVPADPDADQASGTLVFRHAGDVQFRGFERAEATGVYELLAPDTRFFRLLEEHHLHGWIEEAREDPRRLITSL